MKTVRFAIVGCGLMGREFLSAAARCEDEALYEGRAWRVPYYRLAGRRVWGATAMILSELEAMLSSPNLVEASSGP